MHSLKRSGIAENVKRNIKCSWSQNTRGLAFRLWGMTYYIWMLMICHDMMHMAINFKMSKIAWFALFITLDNYCHIGNIRP